ncbi:MAG: pH-sensitive adenylate cyclase [Frankiales bacterium]|nr:pH-sensitive adenylate cyclase [Frankiales bacterium]
MDDLDALLLGEPLTLDREDVERLSGVSADFAREIWASMGFAEIPYGEKAFTNADVEALRVSAALLEIGLTDLPTQLVMARIVGQGLSRLAEAQVDVLRARTADHSPEQALAELAGRADDVLPKLDYLMVFMWRRQFAAAVHRAVATFSETGMPVLSVGFLDLVGFTRSSREWDATTLERTLEHFERDVSLRVAAVNGRVIKTLGDGVLYTCDAALDAVAVALDTISDHDASDGLPAVRAGVSQGPVLFRLGDVFGETVNIASRLSGEARPSSLLVDKRVADVLTEGFEVRELHRRAVRGYRSLTPYLVRRT